MRGRGVSRRRAQMHVRVVVVVVALGVLGALLQQIRIGVIAGVVLVVVLVSRWRPVRWRGW